MHHAAKRQMFGATTIYVCHFLSRIKQLRWLLALQAGLGPMKAGIPFMIAFVMLLHLLVACMQEYIPRVLLITCSLLSALCSQSTHIGILHLFDRPSSLQSLKSLLHCNQA